MERPLRGISNLQRVARGLLSFRLVDEELLNLSVWCSIHQNRQGTLLKTEAERANFHSPTLTQFLDLDRYRPAIGRETLSRALHFRVVEKNREFLAHALAFDRSFLQSVKKIPGSADR